MIEAEKLRQKATTLQNEEIGFAEMAASLVESNPTGMLVVKILLGNEIREFLDLNWEIHEQISELLAGRTLQEIPDIDCLQRIVSLQQKLVELASENVNAILQVLNQD